jgi:hypothetical protein
MGIVAGGGLVRLRRPDAWRLIVKRFRPVYSHDNYGIMFGREQPFRQVGSPLKPSQLLISGFGVRVPGGALPHTPADLQCLPETRSQHPRWRGVVHPWCIHRSATGLTTLISARHGRLETTRGPSVAQARDGAGTNARSGRCDPLPGGHHQPPSGQRRRGGMSRLDCGCPELVNVRHFNLVPRRRANAPGPAPGGSS